MFFTFYWLSITHRKFDAKRNIPRQRISLHQLLICAFYCKNKDLGLVVQYYFGLKVLVCRHHYFDDSSLCLIQS